MNRVFGLLTLTVLFAAYSLGFAANLDAQPPPGTIDMTGEKALEVNNGQDITSPRARIDLRYGHQQLHMAPNGHDSMHIATLRADKPFVISSEWLIATRIDLPFMFTNIPNRNDNPYGKTHFGMSDALAQALLVHVPNKTFAWAAGAQMIFPTASEEQMGTGKYRVVPTAGVRLGTDNILKGSWLALVARWDRSFAENRSNSKDVNELQFAPCVNIWLPGYWFINLFPSPDIRYNLGEKRIGDSGRWFVPANAMVGKMLSKNVVCTLEVGVPIVNDYKVYDFKLEARIGFLF